MTWFDEINSFLSAFKQGFIYFLSYYCGQNLSYFMRKKKDCARFDIISYIIYFDFTAKSNLEINFIKVDFKISLSIIDLILFSSY